MPFVNLRAKHFNNTTRDSPPGITSTCFKLFLASSDLPLRDAAKAEANRDQGGLAEAELLVSTLFVISSSDWSAKSKTLNWSIVSGLAMGAGEPAGTADDGALGFDLHATKASKNADAIRTRTFDINRF